MIHRFLLLLLILVVSCRAISLHKVIPTFPIEPEFALPLSDNQQKQEHSVAHCFSNSMQFDGWRTTACYVRNLCFNTTDKEFLLFSESDEKDDEVSQLYSNGFANINFLF
jgi:hypothetical protein